MKGGGDQVPLEQLLKVSDEPKVTKEEENTFIMQVGNEEICLSIHILHCQTFCVSLRMLNIE
jgi:hypothetical protein